MPLKIAAGFYFLNLCMLLNHQLIPQLSCRGLPTLEILPIQIIGTVTAT